MSSIWFELAVGNVLNDLESIPRIVIVIRSVAAIAASGAGKPAAGQLTRPESGHF
ncbi:hypothetical protein SB461_00325 [Burkholderia cenocepacia]|uniref:hypothetical protein n=1 Tax=Burkholderia cenocepacia TaxID=95486 RepID=UPI0028602E8F|nr:hypothetical protein [Burkholderia cenocepacia]MDR5661862.1 hypothetical protein [Burkholderia cenocepacia]MDR8094832.1 hypothetical protein [Burkholderia cenocepacia]MEB2604952.1 hypothetical protein [Burkholderia cenocepacia]